MSVYMLMYANTYCDIDQQYSYILYKLKMSRYVLLIQVAA